MIIVVVCSVFLPSSEAGTKEEVARLQNDVLTLQNQLREFDKTFSEKMEGLKSLVVQLNDQVAKSGVVLSKISTTIENQSSGFRSSDQALLQEIRALSGKIDDASVRISALSQQIADLKVQSRAIAQPSAASAELSPEAIYDRASGDLVRGNYDLAIQGFNAYLKNNGSGVKAAAAQYGIAEALYYQAKMPLAIAAYSRILSDYPDEGLNASALYKRAKAELVVKESENAIADFREIIEKYPTSSEASLAKTELQNLGVRLTKPAKTTPRKTR
jgi:tol-pal system protein YbgF